MADGAAPRWWFGREGLADVDALGRSPWLFLRACVVSAIMSDDRRKPPTAATAVPSSRSESDDERGHSFGRLDSFVAVFVPTETLFAVADFLGGFLIGARLKRQRSILGTGKIHSQNNP
jgi:hypothetical protein